MGQGWDRRTFLAWGMGAPFLLALRRAVASETAVAVLRIDGMTCGA
jgi:hypothetical protein